MGNVKVNIFLFAIVFFIHALTAPSNSIKILYPNGGEILKTNTTVQIKWSSTNAKGKVILILYKKGIKHSVITKGSKNDGLFVWRIPQKIPEGKNYRVRIRLCENLSINDFSDRDFAIKR